MPIVLVVDDSPMERVRAGKLLLRDPSLTVEYAEHGRHALNHMETSMPDVLVTDLQMPHMNGLELVEAVRRDYPLVPVVLMTAEGSEAIAVEALRKGAASYVPKSVLAEDLLDTVGRILVSAGDDRRHSRLMHALVSSEQRFVLRNDPELIETLVSSVQESLRCLPLSDESERLRVGVAVKHALLHAHFYGNLEIGSEAQGLSSEAFTILIAERSMEPPYNERRLTFTSQISPQQAKFIVGHEGPGFDFSQDSLPDHLNSLDQAVSRGWILMQSIMDEIHLSNGGSEIVIVKRAAPSGDDEDDLTAD